MELEINELARCITCINNYNHIIIYASLHVTLAKYSYYTVTVYI